LLKGGAETVLLSSVLGLDGYRFTIGHGASFEKCQVDRLRANGIRTRQFPLIRHLNPVTPLAAVFSVAWYLRQREFDIVHTHSTEAGIIGRLAAAIADVPNIVHRVHGVPFTDARSPVINRFVLECERIAARHTDRIITNADIMRQEYIDRGIGSAEKYRTIHIGIEGNNFRNVSPATDLPGTRPRITMVSRVAEGKGFGVLIDAIESLSPDDISVCLVGDGPLTDEIAEEIRQRGLQEYVFMTGYREDVPRILAASDIFVLPSFWEGTPRVILEAMASGLPVVATDIAGIPEQVVDGESGYLIPPGDTEALVSRLEQLLTDPSRRDTMGERGQERINEFSVESMITALDSLYKEVLGELT
jgi:glycosyltransferase involved in cell wall biosynthesis